MTADLGWILTVFQCSGKIEARRIRPADSRDLEG